MVPIARKELIRRLRRLRFDGPYHGGKHDFTLRTSDRMRLVLPREDAKSREIGTELQKRILREIGVSTGQWTTV
jgi:hypothetical protein